MIEYLKNLFSFKKRKTSNDFVYDFVKDCKDRHVQLELYYKERIILQVGSLKHNPDFLKWVKIDSNRFKNGYVIFFFLKEKNIDKNEIYKNYKDKESDLEMIEYEYNKERNRMRFFLYFMEEGVEPIELAQKMREVIDGVYRFKEKNPQILFNLRYLKQVMS